MLQKTTIIPQLPYQNLTLINCVIIILLPCSLIFLDQKHSYDSIFFRVAKKCIRIYSFYSVVLQNTHVHYVLFINF